MIEIELRNIQKSFGLKNVLNGINFEVKTGERISLIGENGSGKSTILKIINGTEKQDRGNVNIRKDSTIGFLRQIYGDEKESIIVKDYLKESFKEYTIMEDRLRELELLMSKNIQDLEKILKKYGNLQEKFNAIGGYELEERFKKICSGFKFNVNFLEKKYNLLSGGEKTIVNLAKNLLNNPNILLLDEPTNHLDIEKLEWLENFLIEYKGTIVLISHDRYFLDKVATKTILIENGYNKIYFGNYSYFLKEDEKRTLSEFENYKSQQKQIKKMQAAIRKLRNFGQLAGNEMFFKRAKSIEKRLQKYELQNSFIRENRKFPININYSGKTGKNVLTIKALNKSYFGKVVFNDFDMEVYTGEKVQLKGKNGSRKIYVN